MGRSVSEKDGSARPNFEDHHVVSIGRTAVASLYYYAALHRVSCRGSYAVRNLACLLVVLISVMNHLDKLGINHLFPITCSSLKIRRTTLSYHTG